MSKSKTLNDLEANDCRWPIGDPRHAGFHFCGAQKVAGRPYCAVHWPLSFEPSRGRGAGSAKPAAAKPVLAIAKAA